MSLFRGFMHDFDDDPFFGERKKNSIAYTISADSEDESDFDDDLRISQKQRIKKKETSSRSHMNSMQQMSTMMNSMLADPFGMFDGFGRVGHRGRDRDFMPFGFPNINNIFENFQVDMNNPNCHSYSSSTVMTMSSGPDGRPQVYQASQSTRTAPGGIRETKKSVCDSRTGTKKLAIGHHIGDRSHIKEREQNLHSGQAEERDEFINLEEDEAEDFNREWETKARTGMNAIGYENRARSRRPRDDIPAILDRYRPHYYSPRSRLSSRWHFYPAITSSSSFQETSEKGKKRSQEEKESSDEENSGKKSCKLVKSSHKKKQ